MFRSISMNVRLIIATTLIIPSIVLDNVARNLLSEDKKNEENYDLVHEACTIMQMIALTILFEKQIVYGFKKIYAMRLLP